MICGVTATATLPKVPIRWNCWPTMSSVLWMHLTWIRGTLHRAVHWRHDRPGVGTEPCGTDAACNPVRYGTCSAGRGQTAIPRSVFIRPGNGYGMAYFLEETLGRWFTPLFFEQDPAAVDLIRRQIMATRVDGFIGCSQAIMELDLSRPPVGNSPGDPHHRGGR